MRKMTWILIIAILVVAAAVVLFPEKDSRPADTPTIPETTGNNTVIIENFAFHPSALSIKSGEKVTWINNDSAVHTVVSQNLFESPVLKRGGEFSFTFTPPGTYDYYCGIHPSMKGKIIVQ